MPASKIGLVQKYVGGTKSRPTLARLGGRAWERQKGKVQAAVSDLAAEMLELQAAAGVAARHQLPGRYRVAARIRRLLSLRGDRPTS